MAKFERVYFETAGDGLWSDVSKEVDIVDMGINYCADDKEFGELCVYFDTSDWDIERDGLIYTDKLFLEQLRSFLNEHGLAGDDVEYSEQGMQGDDYVSCDVGAEFIASWEAKFGVIENA
jgi:hypothetical protein